jgi:hypothetical protein
VSTTAQSRRYAAQTSVAPEKTRGEIERTLTRYGASAFGYVYEGSRATIAFKAHGRSVRISLPIEPIESFRKIGYKTRTQKQAEAAYEQALRQKWRALLLVVKAKLEAVASEIVSFDEEFLAYLVLEDGHTVAETVVPLLDQSGSDDVYRAISTAGQRQLPRGESQ